MDASNDAISRFSRRLLLRALGTVLGAAAPLMLSGPAAHAQSAPGVTKTEILVGGVFALSGPVRFVTEPYEQGARSVFDEVNAQGGINGRKLKWLIEDDGYQPARTLGGAKKLVERDGVFALFGQLGLPTTLAVLPYADQAKVPFMTVNATPEPPTKYSFGLSARYPDVIYQLTHYMLTKMGLKKIGYLYQNDDLGEAGREGLARAMKDAGAPLVADVGYERGTTDFETQLLKLRDAGVDAIVSMGTAPATATAVKQGSAVGFHPVWGSYGVGGSLIMQKLLGEDIDGFLFATEVDNQYSDAPGTAAAVQLVRKHFPEAQPDYTTLLGYAHAKVLVAALQESGTEPSRDRLVASLEAMKSFDTGVMPISYGPQKHHGATGVKIFRWQGGKPKAQSDWIPLTGTAP